MANGRSGLARGIERAGSALAGGIRQRGVNLKQEQTNLKRAGATAQFLKAFGEDIGIDPSQVDQMSSDDLNAFAGLIPSAIELQKFRSSKASSERQQQIQGLQAQTALTKAGTANLQLQQQLEEQAGRKTFLDNITKGFQASQQGAQIGTGTQALLNNPSLLQLASANAQGLPISEEMLEKAFEQDENIGFQTIEEGGVKKGVILNKKTGQVLKEISSSPVRTQGVLTPEQTRIQRREKGAFKATQSFSKAAEGAETTLDELNTLEGILKGEDFNTGRGTETFLNAANFLNTTFGLKLKEGQLDKQGIFNNIKQNFLSKRFSETKGAISEKEVALFEKSIPSLSNTTEGNLKLIEFMKAAALKSQLVDAKLLELQSDDTLSERQVLKQIKEFIELPENDIRHLITGGKPPTNAVITPAKAVGQSTTDFPLVTNQEELNRLIETSPGSAFRQPDGQIGIVPSVKP